MSHGFSDLLLNSFSIVTTELFDCGLIDNDNVSGTV